MFNLYSLNNILILKYKKKLFEEYFILFTDPGKCYEVNLSKRYLKIEVNQWSNFTMHIQCGGHEPVENITMEINHTVNVKVSPKIVELHFKNESTWSHMFHVYAIKPGVSEIQFNIGNNTLRNVANDTNVNVDIVKMKIFELYAEWCYKYYYIFSIMSQYPQIFLQFLRLSVVGLDMDYVCFNFISHLSHAAYTFLMYAQTDNSEPNFSVTFTENIHALHGLVTSILLGLQAIKYYGINKRISVIGKELISFYGIIFTFGFLFNKFHIIQYTDFLCIYKYIYLASATTKYIPQSFFTVTTFESIVNVDMYDKSKKAVTIIFSFMRMTSFLITFLIYHNVVVKSTFGWNIWNSILELIGYLALTLKFFLISFNYDQLRYIHENIIFWMACAVVLQHLAFIVQQYFIYNRKPEFDLSELQEITLEEKMTLYEERLDY